MATPSASDPSTAPPNRLTDPRQAVPRVSPAAIGLDDLARRRHCGRSKIPLAGPSHPAPAPICRDQGRAGHSAPSDTWSDQHRPIPSVDSGLGSPMSVRHRSSLGYSSSPECHADCGRPPPATGRPGTRPGRESLPGPHPPLQATRHCDGNGGDHQGRHPRRPGHARQRGRPER